MRQVMANLYSSKQCLCAKYVLNVCIGKQWNCHNNSIFKNKKKFFCLSACIVLNVILLWKTKALLFVVVLHIEQFDYTFACFV